MPIATPWSGGRWTTRPTEARVGQLSGFISSAGPPIGLAYRATFRAPPPPKEWSAPARSMWRESGKSQWQLDVNEKCGLYVGAVVPAEVVQGLNPRMDVVLTPDPAAAVETVYVLEIWGGEVVLPGVRVERRE